MPAPISRICSSETAAKDLRAGSPQHAEKIRVLRFVAGLLHGGALPEAGALRARYAIDAQYVHLPNQFWAHKNHEVIVEALGRLKASGRSVTVVATGLMEDPRQPQHVEKLMQRVARDGLEKLFRPLGVVPYRDMLGLMRHAVAVINPSLFEGWSTSVEEAKSMGKAVVLSDIPVHREQAPGRGLFFDPRDPDAATHALWEAWSGFDPAADEAAVDRAAAELPARLRVFAEGYQDIALEALRAAHE
jgi:glycosyltransferase involved in cell wall biosynthesis